MTTLTLPALVQQFFTDRLTTQMDASPHTIAGYRDTFRLLLRFASAQTGRAPTHLTINDLHTGLVSDFLVHVERERRNSARSRNTRLAAIRSFFRFVALHEPAYLLQCQQILTLPSKRYVRRTVAFLETGLRASELINLRRGDLVTGTGAHLRCEGKGRKQRCTPLRRDTLQVLEAWRKERAGADSDPLFPTLRGTKLSRDALEHLVRRHTLAAARACPSLVGKRVSPHVLRHSTAMELLHHGVDLSVIALWLGHESVETTQVYMHADLRLKEKALARMTAPTSPPGRYRPDDTLLAFLEAL
jgi:integrase/recombinase XerD